MLTYLEMTCLTEERAKGKRSLLSQFAELEDSDEDSEPKLKRKKKKEKRNLPDSFDFCFDNYVP